MTGILAKFEELFDSFAYLLKSAIALITSNRYLFIATILLVLTTGRSFRVGKLFSTSSK